MVAYSFKAFFAPQIVCGLKRQTVRANRKRHALPGEALQLYTGMRTKHCRKILDAVCESVTPVTFWITPNSIDLKVGGARPQDRLSPEEAERLAADDGFAPGAICAIDAVGKTALENMHDFWLREHGVGRFEGVLIRWRAS